MKKINIGIIGLLPISANLGCEALTFSFLEILKRYSDECVVHIIEPLSIKRFAKFQSVKYVKLIKKHLSFFDFKIKMNYFKYLGNKVILIGNKKMDCVIDFTQGESFTDIYGQDRFDFWTKLKEYFINLKIPFIIGSQTIGPFDNKINENRAKFILSNSYKVFSRDIQSYNYVLNNMNIDTTLTTDVAFFLPYKSDNIKSDKIRVGFNVSGLLWQGGYEKNNQFSLSLDYCNICKMIIDYLLKNNYEVHLIGHVLDRAYTNIDNDLVAMNDLKTLYPNIICSPIFDNPIEAKSYISNMDAFIGSRMHATIAALSSKVPVLPISYSRKFEGLFSTLNYKYGINGKEDSNDSAMNKFYWFIENLSDVKNNVDNSYLIIDNMKKQMLDDYFDVFDSVTHK